MNDGAYSILYLSFADWFFFRCPFSIVVVASMQKSMFRIFGFGWAMKGRKSARGKESNSSEFIPCGRHTKKAQFTASNQICMWVKYLDKHFFEYESHNEMPGAYVLCSARVKSEIFSRSTEMKKDTEEQTQNNSNHRWLFMCCSFSAPVHRLIFVIKKIKIQYCGAHNKERWQQWPVAYGISPLPSSSSLSPLSIRKRFILFRWLSNALQIFNFELNNATHTHTKMWMPSKNAVDFYTHILIIINKYWNAWGAYVRRCRSLAANWCRKKKTASEKSIWEIHFGFYRSNKMRHFIRFGPKIVKLTGKIPPKNE